MTLMGNAGLLPKNRLSHTIKERESLACATIWYETRCVVLYMLVEVNLRLDKDTCRILLVKIDKTPGGQTHLSSSEPIGICYIAANLRHHGYDCRLCHLFGADVYPDLKPTIEKYAPTIIGFSVRNFNLKHSATCIEAIRSDFPDITTIVGGECVAVELLNELTTYIQPDGFIQSDGEEAFLNLLRADNPAEAPGLFWRNPDGTYRINAPLSGCVHPEKLPMMLRDGLPMERYCSSSFPGKRYASLHTQRGCRYSCSFCHTGNRYGARKPRSRSISQIISEVDHVVRSYGAESMTIWDEDFFASVERVEGIVDGLLEGGFNLEWQTFMSLSDLKNPALVSLLPKLRQSGYRRAYIGLESFLPPSLSRYNKSDSNQIEVLGKILTDNDIVTSPYYIIGAPDETEEEIAYGLERLSSLPSRGILMDMPVVLFLTPFPGTKVYVDLSVKRQTIDHDWSHYDGEHVVVESQCPVERLYEMRDKFFAESYSSGKVSDLGNSVGHRA
jgi:radical SAM superfamily enzyme YgiQ (UPF0313 family)